MNKMTDKECKRQIFFYLNRELTEKEAIYHTEWLVQTCLSLTEHPERSDYYRRALNRIMKECYIFDHKNKPDTDIIDGLIDFMMAKPVVAALIMKHSPEMTEYIKATEEEKEEAKDCI